MSQDKDISMTDLHNKKANCLIELSDIKDKKDGLIAVLAELCKKQTEIKKEIELLEQQEKRNSPLYVEVLKYFSQESLPPRMLYDIQIWKYGVPCEILRRVTRAEIQQQFTSVGLPIPSEWTSDGPDYDTCDLDSDEDELNE